MLERTRHDEFWWNSITGPRLFVSGAINALLEGKMVVLRVPSDLPWREAMRSTIVNALQERSESDVAIEMIDAINEAEGTQDPGRFLLSRFASGRVRDGYRQSSRQTLQSYIQQSGILRDRLVWVMADAGGETEESATEREAQLEAVQWINFCQDWNTGSTDSQTGECEGLFLIEVHDSVKAPERKNMKVLNFSDYVNRYDVQVFNSFIVDELDNDYSDEWKRYISTLTASLCDFDAEVAECLLRTTDFLHEDPIYSIQRIASSPDFASRASCEVIRRLLKMSELQQNSQAQTTGAGYTDGDDGDTEADSEGGMAEELTRRVWSAQVQVLFPLIELERVQIIREIWDLLEEALAESEVYFAWDTYRQNRIKDPMDLEIGTICHMMTTPRARDGLYILYVPDADMRGRLHFLRECRNRLSHMTCCKPWQIVRLLNYSKMT